jgi:hypothetical protein
VLYQLRHSGASWDRLKSCAAFWTSS